jgi:uncharacterized cupin superfamily protein
VPKIDLDSFELRSSTTYPMPYAQDVKGRHFRRLGASLEDFGVSYVQLEPGAMSSQRHWHNDEDEFVVMIDGEAVLVENEGETVLRAGDCAIFPKGVANGHHLINRSSRDCLFVAIGKPPTGDCHYSDIDMDWDGASQRYVRRDGTPY